MGTRNSNLEDNVYLLQAAAAFGQFTLSASLATRLEIVEGKLLRRFLTELEESVDDTGDP